MCIINLIRIPFLAKPSGNDPLCMDSQSLEGAVTNDQPGTDTPSSIWTHAELCLGIVSACLPCYRPVFRGVATVFSTNKSKSSSLTPQSRSKVSADPYKSLEGKETSIGGSNIALVPSGQWKPPYMQSKDNAKVAIEGGRKQDVESRLPLHAIGVTRDINVSRSAAR